MSAAEQWTEEAFGPQPGPQTLFATTEAQVAILGGGAGGGKSIALLYEGGKITLIDRVRAARVVLFRREKEDLKRGGGLWDKAAQVYPLFGGLSREAPSLDWTFEASTRRIEDRHRIQFRHLQRERSIYSHDGTEYDLIGFDELQQFTERQFWYMFSRLRSRSGLQPRIRATCNPMPGSWLYKLVAWWIGPDGYAIRERSGVIRWFVRDPKDEQIAWFDSREEALAAFPRLMPRSFTFILASLDDNPALERADPSYRGNLEAMTRAERARLLGTKDEAGRDRGGNWLVRDTPGDVFRRQDVIIVDRPPSRIVASIRFWDRAASSPTPKKPNPDWTRGPRVSLTEKGQLYVDDLESAQTGPVRVTRLLQATAKADGPEIEVGLWQDTGGAGKTDVETMRVALAGFSVRIVLSFVAGATDEPEPEKGSSRAKRIFANAWAPLVEHGRFFMKRAPWNEEVLQEMEAFPYGTHDDIVDGISGAAQVLIAGNFLSAWGARTT